MTQRFTEQKLQQGLGGIEKKILKVKDRTQKDLKRELM